MIWFAIIGTVLVVWLILAAASVGDDGRVCEDWEEDVDFDE